VFTTFASALPAFAEVRFGSLNVAFDVHIDPSKDTPVVALNTTERPSANDFLSVASTNADAGQALVVYGTRDMSWSVRVWLPAFLSDQVVVLRQYEGALRPAALDIERTFQDGRAMFERIPAEMIRDQTIVVLPVAELKAPCPLTWWWEQPTADPRPMIVYPESEQSSAPPPATPTSTSAPARSRRPPRT
jgi:hypothetical protein